MSGKKRFLLGCVAALVVVAVGVPAIAGAGPFANRVAAQNSLSAGVAGVNQSIVGWLRQRVVVALERRKLHFDTVADRLTNRLARMQTLTDKVAATGQDVSAVRTALSGAQTHLDSAKSLEQQAVTSFQAVPTATDKRAAFQQARALGRQAGAELRSARSQLQSGVSELRTIVQRIKASASSASSNVQ